ncbi:ATP synthase subunit alpha, chloroplastic-like [Vitis vinifera]|uniref:ATP synthase subunit alpha, chloroplastic n=1 Tax=Vitis vinifera TaxID=29760 RepID=A0A438K9J5_VITVI|nr:ATP synthase subunit alpha, chloroplastic-like [Vitis vinifera]RVX17889.1 ATP synthase subunit alpha, chloroplastic [Vitis vinifera]|eukprot:XP_019081929.1 PREDICTED: uncharacterized protein LOC109124299 [Vitis vinifera]
MKIDGKCLIELIGSCRNKVQVYRSVRMPQLHTSYFHLTPIVMINGSSRCDLLLNSQNFCRSIPVGAENPSPDTILNQQGQNVICVYVAIGQKASSVAQVVTTFQERGAMEYTIVVAETADSPATLQYLAPYTGAALAEYFVYHKRHTLNSIHNIYVSFSA